MRRKIILLILTMIIIIPFFLTPSTGDSVAALKHITLTAIFGDVRQKVMSLCYEKEADGALAGTLGAHYKDGWGEEVDFIWKDNKTILLKSSGEDKIKGSFDDVGAVASCNTPYLTSE